MATRQEIHAKLAAIEQRKADALKALQARRLKLKAQLAQLDRPTRSQRRLDARRKILLGAFVLEQLERSGVSVQSFSFEGQRFLDWLIRPTDQAVFDALPTSQQRDTGPSPTSQPSASTVLEVPFADKDQAKALGALWQPDIKRWVVPPGGNLAPFERWMSHKEPS